MARKSGWQQFSDNFNSVYGTFNKLGQQIETNRLMDDDEFTKEGGLGYDSTTNKALEGSALERARYKALGDIATKYGDTEGGLANRTALANLDATDRQNRMDEKNFNVLTEIQGTLAKQALVTNMGLTKAQADRLNTLTPVEIKNLEQNIKSSEAATIRNDADSAQGIINSENQNKNRDVGTKTASELAAQSIKDSENQNTNRTKTADSTVGLNQSAVAQREQQTAMLTEQNRVADLETALLTEVNNEAFRTENNIETDEQAQAALLDRLSKSNIPLSRQQVLRKTITDLGLAPLQEEAAKLTLEAEAALKKGVPSLVDWYEGVNTKDTIKIVSTDDGGVALVSTVKVNGKNVEKIQFTGQNENEIAAQVIAQIKDPGSAFQVAALKLNNDKLDIDIAAKEKALEVSDAQIESLKTSMKLTIVQARNYAAKTKEILQNIDRSLGLSTSALQKVQIEGLQKFVAGQLLNDPGMDDEELQGAVSSYLEQTQQASPPPITITPRTQ